MKKLADEKRVKREAHEREEEERQRRYLAQQVTMHIYIHGFVLVAVLTEMFCTAQQVTGVV